MQILALLLGITKLSGWFGLPGSNPRRRHGSNRVRSPLGVSQAGRGGWRDLRRRRSDCYSI